jgi:hypothetical protein
MKDLVQFDHLYKKAKKYMRIAHPGHKLKTVITEMDYVLQNDC